MDALTIARCVSIRLATRPMHKRCLTRWCVPFMTRATTGFYSVDAEGAPLDTTKDLYTHAFVVFAYAEYARRSRRCIARRR
ncbi:MAG: Mannose-6-phosphate isomerase (EC [uncultured Paraburkholderia sp.]|nr:MAG: Mannose-6-phosphate isomerase (EC [uncultured Paraburkholderia sp.]